MKKKAKKWSAVTMRGPISKLSSPTISAIGGSKILILGGFTGVEFSNYAFVFDANSLKVKKIASAPFGSYSLHRAY